MRNICFRRLAALVVGAALATGLLAAPVAAAGPVRTQLVACNAADLAGPSHDTYCLLKQYLFVHHNGAPGNGSIFDNGSLQKDLQIASLTAIVLLHGAAYFPLDAYPALSRADVRTAWVLFVRHARGEDFNDPHAQALFRAYRCGCDTRTP